jgi:hypothetical protein
MAEGISKTLQDLGNFGTDELKKYLGFRRGVSDAVGNVGRYFTSEAPVTPNFSPLGSSASSAVNAAADRQAAEVNRLGGQSALNAAMQRGMSEAPNQFGPNRPTATPGGPGGMGQPAVNPIDALFAPMFQSLSQREQTANQRYEANKQQVTNIYGQITGARTADIATTGEAFRRLSDAASARSTAVNTSIDESEAARLRNNQAALESMGIGGLSTSQGDIASQGAAMAKNTNQLNAENWQGLLTAMGANAQDIARADVTGFNYRMGEDLGQLRGSREEFLQGLEQERFGLTAQQAQATFDFQQQQQAAAASAAAAARSATNAADRAAAERAQDLLDNADPLTRATSRGIELGYVNFDPVKVQDAYNGWMINRGTKPTDAGRTSWDRGSAIADAISYAGTQLSNDELRALQDAIGNSY